MTKQKQFERIVTWKEKPEPLKIITLLSLYLIYSIITRFTIENNYSSGYFNGLLLGIITIVWFISIIEFCGSGRKVRYVEVKK